MRDDIDEETIGEIRRAYKRTGPASTAWAIADRFGLTTDEVLELCDPRLRAAAKREAKAAAERVRREATLDRLQAKAAARIVANKAAESRAKREAARDAEIRRLWSSGTTGRALAKRFGMAPSKVSGIVAGLPRPLRYADPEAVPRLPPLPRPPAAPEFPAGPPDPRDRLVAEPTVRGSEHGRAILDEDKVIEMRWLRTQGWSTGRLAGRYGVSRNTVCYAISGKTWRHVPPSIGGISS